MVHNKDNGNNRCCPERGVKGEKSFFVLAIFCILLLPSFQIFPLDPGKKISEYIQEVWQTDEGLPDNCVFTVTQTRDGYIWLGTQQGLVRYNGSRFYIFNSNNTREIKENYIQILLEDHKGNLWIGTRGGGLIRYTAGKFKAYTTKDGLSSNQVRSIYEDRAGNLWIGTYGGGLNLFKEEKFTVFSTKEGLSHPYVLSILEDIKGNLWVGTYGGGLNRFEDNRFITYHTAMNQPNDFIWSIYEDRNGNLWFGTYKRGLLCFRNGKFYNFTSRDGLSNDYVRSLCEDSDGNLWVGTQGGGLNRFQDGKFTCFTTAEGLSHNFIYSIYEDREGNLWISTLGGGVNVLKNNKFINYTTRQGLSNDFVRTIYEDSEGGILLGTFGGGLNRFKDGTFKIYSLKTGFANDYVTTVLGDQPGNIWIGTPDTGLIQLDMKSGNFISYSIRDGLSNNYISCLYLDKRGGLWIGTRSGGLNRFRDGKFRNYSTSHGLPKNDVRSVHEDQQGNLWIGTYGGGLCRMKDEVFLTYTRKDGLSSNIVYTIYEDRQRNLWIGTHRGLNRLKNGEFTVYTSKQGLYDQVIFQIFEDEKGCLWMSCIKGVFQVQKKMLKDFAEGKIDSIHCIAYGRADGMKSAECTGGSQPAGWKTRDGRLWFPTKKGVAVIDPNNLKINSVIPPVIIEKVKVDNEDIELNENKGILEISPGKKRFEFFYTALSFTAPQRVEFMYKLEGFDEDWLDVGAPAERIAPYTNLSPGKYCFRVKACSSDGIWNETGASLRFILKPFFYQTYWFYGLCALGIILLVVVVHLLRVRQVIIRERRKYEKVRLTPGDAERYLNKLLHFMDTEKPYLDPDLSLHKLSEDIKIPDHFLSQVINARLKQNFYDFINQYRIEEAKRILVNSRNHQTILEVAFDVGFNSKSAFNRAFKKHMDMTPSDFKIKNN